MNTLNRMRQFFCILFLLVTTTVLRAQDSGWSVNQYDYQYDMTAYVQLSVDGVVVNDYSNYEVGAFVNEECRGVANVMSQGGYIWLYLRIWSNVASGETVSLKVFDKTTDRTYNVAETITFASQSMVGQPSSPITATMKSYLPGDVNNDGEINFTDVTLVLALMAGEVDDTLTIEAADVNGDGKINISDVTSILSIMAR